MTMPIFKATALLVLIVSLSTLSVAHTLSAPTATIYYVDAASTAANPDGSASAPFPQIQDAVDRVQAGDTVYVRGGVYQEAIQIWASGQPGQPIVIAMDPASTTQPVIDGAGYTLPDDAVKDPAIQCATLPGSGERRCFVYRALVDIRGKHIEFRDFIIRQSRGRGLLVIGQGGTRSSDILISDCVVRESYYQAFKIESSDGVTVQRCQVFHSGSFAPFSRPGSELGWGAAVAIQDADSTIIRDNTVHENYGEGITIGRNSTNSTVEDNMVYNNMAVQIYVHRARGATVQKNLVYHTNDPEFWRSQEGASDCIALNNENNFPDALAVESITIRNNVTVGCGNNIAIWNTQGTGDPIKDVLIERNTLVNAVSGLTSGAYGFSASTRAPLENIRFQYNIVVQGSGSAVGVPDTPAISFTKNLWWPNAPQPHASHDDDVRSDPLLANPNAALVRGAVQVDWYRPQPGSPALANNIGPSEYYVMPSITPIPPPIADPTSASTASATPTRTSAPPATVTATMTATTTSTPVPPGSTIPTATPVAGANKAYLPYVIH